ncbi:MAG: hypothetical protein U0359_23555 [Byssovorax sp.]
MNLAGIASAQSQPQSISLTVFNDYVGTASTAAGASVTAQTDASLDEVLGFYDQLAIQVVVDDATVGTAPAGLTVQIAHSADGLNFLYKNTTPEISTPTQLNIGTPTYMSFGYDRGAYPSLGLVRLVIVLTAAVGPVRAHVRITVMGNNQNEQAFTRMVDRAMVAQTAASKKYVLVYGPGQKVAASAILELIRFVSDLPTASAYQIALQQQAAYGVLDHPGAHTPSDVASARAFLLWEPILLLKNAGGFNGQSVTVPNEFMIAFLGNGHYVLARGGAILWESREPSTALFPGNVSEVKTPLKAPTGGLFTDFSPGSGPSTGPGYKPL